MVGQEMALASVKGALAEGRLAHAYIFAGPASVGKATLALKLAQALNCTGAEPPCGECISCRRIEQGLHADTQVIGIEADGDRAHKVIRIQQVREIERVVSLRPYEGVRRVVIVDPADGLNEEAQNAFLKTLEEPPDDVIFVLVTTNEGALLDTIRSRCRRVEFATLSAEAIESALRERGTPGDRAALLARLAQGKIGWAIKAVSDPAVLVERDGKFRAMLHILGSGTHERFAQANNLAMAFSRDRSAVMDMLDLWLEWWRDVLLIQAGCEGQVVNAHLTAELKAIAYEGTLPSTVDVIEAVRSTKTQLARNANARLALEVLLLDLPRIEVREEEMRAGASL